MSICTSPSTRNRRLGREAKKKFKVGRLEPRSESLLTFGQQKTRLFQGGFSVGCLCCCEWDRANHYSAGIEAG